MLGTRFEELCKFRELALDWSDPEGVHSMRVASRRLRSALRDFTPYLRKRRLTSILKLLRSLADALGEVRDQDVAIMALEKLSHQIPDEFAGTLKEYIDARKQQRDQARAKLESRLEKEQLMELALSFRTALALAAPTPKPNIGTGGPVAQISFLKMSRAIILGRLKELEKLSPDLFKPFDVEPLHEMRIAAKRLRYAIELFQQCWGRSIATFARRTARLQTALGDVHDCDVWIESFGKEINSARKQKQTDKVDAFVWLLSHFVKLRTKHLRQAFRLWNRWEAQDTSNKLRAVLLLEKRRRQRDEKGSDPTGSSDSSK